MLRFALFRPVDSMEIDRDNDPIRRPAGRHAGHFLGYVSRSQAALNKFMRELELDGIGTTISGYSRVLRRMID